MEIFGIELTICISFMLQVTAQLLQGIPGNDDAGMHALISK